MKDVGTKEKEKSWKEFIGSTRLSNIIAGISVGVSVVSLFMANTAMQTVENNVEATNVSCTRTVNEIVNEGIRVEDVDYISKDNDKEMMDKAYDAEDILELIDENPNLSFCLFWYGSQEEYELTDWDKMPPNIKIEIWDEDTGTLYMDFHQ